MATNPFSFNSGSTNLGRGLLGNAQNYLKPAAGSFDFGQLGPMGALLNPLMAAATGGKGFNLDSLLAGLLNGGKTPGRRSRRRSQESRRRQRQRMRERMAARKKFLREGNKAAALDEGNRLLED